MQVGGVADLDVWSLTGVRPVFTAGASPDGPIECEVQVRAHGEAVGAIAELATSHAGDVLQVSLRAPLRGVAPGQTMVLYRPDPTGDEVIGSATISNAPNARA